MNFLINRYRNKSYAESTGFNEKMKIDMAEKKEEAIERLKNMKPFNYINA
jgi:hypothetical protein